MPDQVNGAHAQGWFAMLRAMVQFEKWDEIIADQTLRENDPAAQLAQLREVSEAISAFQAEHQRHLPPRLNHFLERASLQKALEFIEHGAQGDRP